MTESVQRPRDGGKPSFWFGFIFGLLTAAVVVAGFQYWATPAHVLAAWYIFVLFVAGVMCLLVEAALPGVGFFGVAGLGLIILSLFMASSRPQGGWEAVALAAVVSPYLTWLSWRLGIRRLFRGRLMLQERLDSEAGYVAGGRYADLVGQTGRTLTPLRPAGSVDFGDQRVDVVTQGEFVPADTPVKVVKVDGWHVTVRAVNTGDAATDPANAQDN